MAHEVVVREADRGERIDRFLSRQFAKQSRSSIQRQLRTGGIRVNGNSVSPSYRVLPHDRISIHEATSRQKPIRVTRTAPEPTVLFENDSVIVINKPPGLTVHAGINVQEQTLVDWLRKKYPSITSVGDNPTLRPGIVHRLDRDVSGVMVIAKTQPSFDNLKRQFQRRKVRKEYLALVYGMPKNREGTIRLRITRSKRQHGRMTTRPPHAEGRDAVTHYHIERVFDHTTLLRIRLETGRTHQIRVHLKAIGHPIVGDPIYTTKLYQRFNGPTSRPLLHAVKLQFTDIDGVARTFTAPLPRELRVAA